MAKGKNHQPGGAAAVVEALVRPTVEGFGLRLWDVRFEKEGPDWFLRVLIDRDEPLELSDRSRWTRTPARRFPAPSTRFWTRLTPLTRATTLKSAAPAWAAD